MIGRPSRRATDGTTDIGIAADRFDGLGTRYFHAVAGEKTRIVDREILEVMHTDIGIPAGGYAGHVARAIYGNRAVGVIGDQEVDTLGNVWIDAQADQSNAVVCRGCKPRAGKGGGGKITAITRTDTAQEGVISAGIGSSAVVGDGETTCGVCGEFHVDGAGLAARVPPKSAIQMPSSKNETTERITAGWLFLN
jgi:hypothetical protein